MRAINALLKQLFACINQRPALRIRPVGASAKWLLGALFACAVAVGLVILESKVGPSGVRAPAMPLTEDIVNAEIVCDIHVAVLAKGPVSEKWAWPQPIALDHEASVALLSFLRGLDDQWMSWGPITPPAGDIGVTFHLMGGGSYFIGIFANFESLALDAGHRDLSQPERLTLRSLLQTCARVNGAPSAGGARRVRTNPLG